MAKEKLAPPIFASFESICKLPRDHVYIGDFSIMTDGETVWLTEQETGAAPVQNFEISRETFNRLLVWYETGLEAFQENNRRRQRKPVPNA